jgi:hypothetical protein
MQCRQEDGELVVTVTNHATGHNFPGERHNRVLLLQLTQRAADGRVVVVQQDRIKDITPLRGESSADQIRADQTYESRFTPVEGAVGGEVELLYKRFPWCADRDADRVAQDDVDWN